MRLEWSEEFAGEAGGPPDRDVWVPELGGGGWGDGQLQHYTDSVDNAVVDGHGRLAITARPPDAPGGPITSARLVTAGSLGVRCGRVEARIQVPAGDGLWAAFWMLGADIDQVGWPACGEIDVMEVVGSRPTAVHGTLHGPGYAGLSGGIGHVHESGTDLTSGFHVYGVDWTPERVTWLLDGVPYGSVRPADVPGPWPFDHEFYLLLNLAVGGDWPGNSAPDPALPATMLVDWVRVHGSTVSGRARDGYRR